MYIVDIFCLHHGQIKMETKNNLYEHYHDQFWWIIIFDGKKWYMNIYIYA